ncbi:hypothetical protein LG314_12625 [Agrococcus terreus]|uniref:hypothetical protein n=1 Tax=Agrococcus terreus TaxID=574649 RepID=UPI00384BA92E
MPTRTGGVGPGLIGVLPEELRIQRTYWLVVPRDLAELLRVRVITDAIDALVAEHPHLSVRAR